MSHSYTQQDSGNYYRVYELHKSWTALRLLPLSAWRGLEWTSLPSPLSLWLPFAQLQCRVRALTCFYTKTNCWICIDAYAYLTCDCELPDRCKKKRGHVIHFYTSMTSTLPVLITPLLTHTRCSKGTERGHFYLFMYCISVFQLYGPGASAKCWGHTSEVAKCVDSETFSLRDVMSISSTKTFHRKA